MIFPPPVTLPYTKPAALFAFREGVLFLFLAKNVQLPSYHITFSLFVNGFGAKSNANQKFRNVRFFSPRKHLQKEKDRKAYRQGGKYLLYCPH